MYSPHANSPSPPYLHTLTGSKVRKNSGGSISKGTGNEPACTGALLGFSPEPEKQQEEEAIENNNRKKNRRM